MRPGSAIVIGAAIVLQIVAASVSIAAEQDDSLPEVNSNLRPGEVQRLFDAFELVRAQEMLSLSARQYPQFVAKLKALQDARRVNQQQRNRMLRDLRQLSNLRETNNDEELAKKFKELILFDQKAAETLVFTYGEIDEVLDLRQRVRFRLFERTMERRRLDLLMSVRSPQGPSSDRPSR